ALSRGDLNDTQIDAAEILSEVQSNIVVSRARRDLLEARLTFKRHSIEARGQVVKGVGAVDFRRRPRLAGVARAVVILVQEDSQSRQSRLLRIAGAAAVEVVEHGSANMPRVGQGHVDDEALRVGAAAAIVHANGNGNRREAGNSHSI